MRLWDQISSFLGMGSGILLALFSVKLDLGRLNQPGPGFLPLGASILLVLLSGIYAVRSFWTQDEGYIKQESPWPQRNRGKIAGVLGALLLFVLFLDILGFIVTTFFLMLFFFRLGGPESWLATVAKAAASVLVSYAIFGHWLMVQFPKGFLGI
jgi:putative tricarboxylic transport membrane protein